MITLSNRGEFVMRFTFTALTFALLAGCGSQGNDAAASAGNQTTASTAPQPQAQAQAQPQPAEFAGPLMSKEELGQKVCFFSAAEVEKAMGFAVGPGKPEPSLASHGMFACSYDGKLDGLRINAIWIDPSQVAASRASMTRISAGQIDRIAGDPDAAYLQYQGEIGGALHYMRGNVMIELRPVRWGQDNAAMKAKLLSLRRVP